LDNRSESWVSTPCEAGLGGAIAAKATVLPGETREITMTLAWDLPVIEFGGGSDYFRRYTKYFGPNGRNAVEIAKTALYECDEWSKQIDRWHREFTEASARPDWYRSMVLNELYMIIDGLTVWTDTAGADGKAEDFFGLIECPDYDFYNTLDLWVYGSFVFLKYWPEIEKSVSGLYAKNALDNDTRLRKLWDKPGYFPVNVRGSLPHDHGHPKEDPVGLVNGYAWQDVSKWKDLNSQFVLTVYRDYVHTGDEAFLKRCYPAAKEAVLAYTIVMIVVGLVLVFEARRLPLHRLRGRRGHRHRGPGGETDDVRCLQPMVRDHLRRGIAAFARNPIFVPVFVVIFIDSLSLFRDKDTRRNVYDVRKVANEAVYPIRFGSDETCRRPVPRPAFVLSVNNPLAIQPQGRSGTEVGWRSARYPIRSLLFRELAAVPRNTLQYCRRGTVSG